MRIHELAKQLNLTSKELIAKIEALGGEAKGPMSAVDEALLAKLKSAAAPASKAPAVSKTAAEKETGKKAAPAPAKKPEPKAASQAPAAPGKVEKKSAPAEPVKPSLQPAPVKETKPAESPKPAVSETPAAKPITVAAPAESAAPRKTVAMRFPITVGNFAAMVGESISKVIKALMAMGIFANVNQPLNEEVVTNLADVLQIKVTKQPDEEEKILKSFEPENGALLKSRPPVVTLMGHVDHGKTSLLDAIRHTNVAATEKGAITQHVGAYGVDIPGKGHVTFLDTPGHEAFTAMRARGANITDVVVLVVAADDGIMPQTIEAVDHAREAGCPIVVAINKVDLPSANVQKVMGGLQQIGLTPEAWGGKTICVEVSAKTGKGIPQLLEMLLLEAEILELKANYDCPATGTVIEGHLSKGSGPVATMMVQRGVLNVGDLIVCGVHMGRVRAMKNDRGKQVKDVTPSYAVSIMGLAGVPEAGDTFFAVEDEKTARKITEKKLLEQREKELSNASRHLSLENLYDRITEGNFKALKLIIKADVQGSMEALAASLEKLSNDQCQVRVIHSGIGAMNESDVMLAAASDAVLIGFHVRADGKAESIAEKEGVSMRYYNIIYEAIEEVQKAMEGLLEPTYTEVIDGRLEIRKIFHSSKAGSIGGAYVIKGKVTRTGQARVLRNGVVLFEGKLASLKRFKDDVREVAQGYECGVAVEGFNQIQEGDIVESFHMDKVATKLSS